MAVCVQHKKTKKIIRVSKAEAKKLYASGEYNYTSKSEWQRHVGKEAEPVDHTDDVCPCGDPDCSRPFGHEEVSNGETEG